MQDDAHRRGKSIDEIKEGDSLTVTECISERELLIYLGLTNDSNPLYVQTAFAQSMGYKAPVVPPVMLSGILTSSISKLLPGPGSEIVNVATNFIEPVYHEETITFTFEVIKVDLMKEVIMISVEGTNENGNRILDSVIMVRSRVVSIISNSKIIWKKRLKKMNNDPNLYEGQKLVKDANGFFMKMYGYMAAAVGISAVTAFMAANVPSVVSLVSNGLVMSILFIMQLVLVFRMSSLKAIRTSGKALSSLIFYSMIEGLFLSGLLYKYTAMDITRAFIAAAVLFVVLAVMGTSTKKDLSGIGRQALAALIALIIVSIVNLFLHSTMIQYVFSFIGIVVFSVLTAYDSQTYKVMYYQYGSQVNTDSLAAVGALNLYLDFLNIFLYLLQIFGIGSSDND